MIAFNILGTGTGFVGRSAEQPDGTFVATDWVILFGLPLLPLRSRRVAGINMEGFVVLFVTISLQRATGVVGPAPLDRQIDPKYSRMLRQVVTYVLAISIYWGLFLWLLQYHESIGAWGMPAGLVFAVILYYIGRRLEPPAK